MSRPTDDFGPVQLARWLGLKESQLRRAQNLGLVPPPDIEGRQWSRSLALTLPGQIEQILDQLGETAAPASAPTDQTRPAATKRTSRGKPGFGPVQLARHLGLKDWQLSRAQQRGHIPGPDLDGGRWSDATAEPLAALVPGILAELGDHPGLGSQKAADHLAEHTDLPVERTDVQDLAEQRALQPVGEFKGWPMYAIEDLEALSHDQIENVIATRRSWTEQSLTSTEAAGVLGWSVGRFEATAEEHNLTPGRYGRYARTDVENLTRTTH
ncbi:hypothetical protein [Streptomyces avermitilis]|uniref:hypothetical protein n=1 Tax=Streptomyces avermitilis TaxID=33903 RepID=UPI0038061106